MASPGSPVRNPSPPPLEQEEEEEVLKGDLIPGTAYSKQWLFSSLLKLLRKVEGLQMEGTPAPPTDRNGGKPAEDPREKVRDAGDGRTEGESKTALLSAAATGPKSPPPAKDGQATEDKPDSPPSSPRAQKAESHTNGTADKDTAENDRSNTEPQSPLTDQKLDEIIPPGYEVLEPSTAGEKIDDETDGELCQV